MSRFNDMTFGFCTGGLVLSIIIHYMGVPAEGPNMLYAVVGWFLAFMGVKMGEENE